MGAAEIQPIVPLPDVVFFPKTILPLHIFEPRYRLLTAEALAGSRSLCVVLLKPGWEADYLGAPEVYPVGCVGRIVQHQELPDGRYLLSLRGESKVLLESEERREPYRVARIRRIVDDDDWSGTPAAAEAAAELVRLFQRARPRPGSAPDLAQIFGSDPGAEAILNSVAMHLNVDPETRQHLLEIESVGARYRSVLQILRGAGTTQERIDRARHRYPKDKRAN